MVVTLSSDGGAGMKEWRRLDGHCMNRQMDMMCAAFVVSDIGAVASLHRRGQGRVRVCTSRANREDLSMNGTERSAQRVTLVDYGAGNVRSLQNALKYVGVEVVHAQRPQDILDAEAIIFPGVGAFGAAMHRLKELDYVHVLKEFIEQSGRPFFGICIGMQALFEASEESPGVKGLGVFPGVIRKFDTENGTLGVPHIGWNTMQLARGAPNGEEDWFLRTNPDAPAMQPDRYYFVHSYRLGEADDVDQLAVTHTVHGHQRFAAAVMRENVLATQCHPEKSGKAGLALLRAALSSQQSDRPQLFLPDNYSNSKTAVHNSSAAARGLSKRVVACLDVRENDAGDLVVTKGDQYDVREKHGNNEVRNLGKPIEVAARYYQEGADEVTFLNITSFRGEPLGDAPMLSVLERTSEKVFVPLCIGGGIRDYTDAAGNTYSSLDVASKYFRSGADKVSLGSDAVYAAEAFYCSGGTLAGTSSIEQISRVYGAQAVVVSVDPKKVWVADAAQTDHVCATSEDPARWGPNGERFWWYQCTVKGGREGRDMDVVQLVTACEHLGAGEILLNSMDADGTNKGFDLDLVRMVTESVSIPVIASSGAGCPQHFVDVFQGTGVEAALAAGIFHRREVSIAEVKECMDATQIRTRL
ncbi:Imidazole glycerol phosphate synthase hisHF [Porphyridium purpureum]|uniref:Imidazole glycerol phosphate synthase hisHF n=1 Tax=Porphyridium purpureum TaxID=35688 RepID=A0A5J4YN37_PORPP|nr:Imidazole glycerol phosphate synthase hisHF [Porphyridium purpureum]|eukprot:POR0200..scf295_9